ncbi:MAG TPA: ABC transporter permease [Polyangiaceae bacterium]|nr:ABC transporter permease [Polyangiaceae bacterium]
MSLLQTFRIAFRALLRNKMRSFLTTLGVVIGVGAVIAMVAIGEGAKSSVEQAFAAMGTNLLIVMPGANTSGGVRGGFGSQPTLTWDDLKAIQTELPTVKAAAAFLRSTSSVVSEDQNWTTQIGGTSPEYLEIRSWPIAQGRAFTQSDVESSTKVALLGRTVADKLYGPSSNPVGQLVRINNVPFEVIGLLATKGQSAIGQDYDDTVLVPYSTFRSKIQGGLKNYLSGTIFVQGTSQAELQRTQDAVTSLLRDRHRLAQGVDDDFSIRNLTEMASAQQQGTETMTTLLASIAFVSLLVGGIGIMNIMLVSVTERTREIGLRMAIGAKPHQILAQFLVEAFTLSSMGGALGVMLGVGIALYLASRFGWPLLIRPDIIAVSVLFSALVGVCFGLYPAYKASRLDPIDALRYE